MTPLSELDLTALEQSYDHDIGLASGAVAEIRHLREQVTRLQQRGSDLTVSNRALLGAPLFVRAYAWPGCALPDYRTAGAAGADCRARLDEPMTLLPGRRFKFPLGFAVELPEGWELQVRPRSGLADKYGIAMVNAPGTIDGDYRGEVCANLINLGEWQWIVNPGDRIAQVVLAPVRRADWASVKSLADLGETERGAAGHGSTGVK